jgi:ribonuclease VapC
MIVDSSALVAIILEEPGAIACMSKLSAALSISISAVTLTETSMVLLSRGGQGKLDVLDAYLAQLEIEVVPVDRVQSLLAREAFDRYGKGRNKAGLNLGDCFVYALAKYYGEPLLFLGNDFNQTDLLVA